MAKTVLLATTAYLTAAFLGVLSPSSVSADDVSHYCKTPADGIPYGSYGRQDTPAWRLRQCKQDVERQRTSEENQSILKRERQRKEKLAREAQQKAEQEAEEGARNRDAAVGQRRQDAERQRAADCANYGTCPSTSQDIHNQLKPNSR